MPLPRYTRLPVEAQQKIINTAKVHFSQNGYSGASYNKIISDTGISKTSFYLYFDGKDDLYQEVLRSIRYQLLEVLGHWKTVETETEFWNSLKLKSTELATYLEQRPDDLKLSQIAIFESKSDITNKWIYDLILNGQQIGIIRSDIDLELIFYSTISFFQAIDQWTLKVLSSGKTLNMDSVWSLLKGLWRPI